MRSNEELAALWRWFVATEAAGYSPLYTVIVESAANDRDVLALVASAPETSHHPLMMLAAVHDLVLSGGLPDLAAVYAGDVPVDEAPSLFRAAVLDHREQVSAALHERFVQTNECGRAAPIALGLAAASAAVGEPDALIDAGASAGLNLVYDRYRLDLGDHGVWGDPESSVVCPCDVAGAPPQPLRFVDIPVRVGLDRAPVDITDPTAVRWLLACTWPDTGRLERTRAAIAIAQSSPPDVRTGDLVAEIGPLIDDLDGDGPVCVVTSWTLGYLDKEQRKEFVGELAAAGAARPVAWLSFEHPGVVSAISAAAPSAIRFGTAPSLAGLTTFGPGGHKARPLAHVHPHGSALEWALRR